MPGKDMMMHSSANNSTEVMEFKKGISQAWRVIEYDNGNRSDGIPPIGHRYFNWRVVIFSSLTIKLKQYKITASKTNVWISAFQ